MGILLDDLDELLKQVNPEGYWYCEVKNFGWKSQSGYAYLEFSTGREMIQKVLPRTECSFHIFREEYILRIQNYHHDSPTGNEWYELTPINSEQYENQSM